MDIINLLRGNTEGLSEEEALKVEEFTENLKETLIEELINYKVKNLIEKLKDDEEEFYEEIKRMLFYGSKGYNKMSMELIINIYLEEIGNEQFVNLINNLKL